MIGLCFVAPRVLAQQPSVARPAESCGRADPSYIRVANETGGLPLFLKPSEAGRIGHFIRETSGSSHETLLWATGTLSRGRQPLAVSVDSTVERITFSLSVDGEGSTLAITRPSGVPIRTGDPDTEITEIGRASCRERV